MFCLLALAAVCVHETVCMESGIWPSTTDKRLLLTVCVQAIACWLTSCISHEQHCWQHEWCCMCACGVCVPVEAFGSCMQVRVLWLTQGLACMRARCSSLACFATPAVACSRCLHAAAAGQSSDCSVPILKLQTETEICRRSQQHRQHGNAAVSCTASDCALCDQLSA